ncbi:hypothetical protein FRC19_008977 [Serendipita sp. 401]|nr:hypothetical protein FRC19_008977 [Serendipita sp. 401]KAG8839228.1 hypothetical protein FRC18_000084 [Serendipita sp. 400]KAG9056623.1 hypothetical protein FS842_010143 [Serendipita sp. 407]
MEENYPEIKEIRITDHTKIRNFVAFGLKCLTETPRATIMLHTLPHFSGKDDSLPEEPPVKKEKLASSTANIARLVSIAEIIKREFASLVSANKGIPHNPPGTLLHQYNIINILLEAPTKETKRVDVLQALEGKSHLRRNNTPYMKIYLSTCVRDDLVTTGATYQPAPPPPKKSRSARARAKKRLEREKAAQEVQDVEQTV